MGLISNLLRHWYPLQSGLGTIANSPLLKRMDGNPKGDVVAPCGRFTLVVPQDDFVRRSIKYFGDLDKKVTWVVGRVLQPGDTALDVGANLGLVSFKMLECVGALGKVIAFEPQSRMVAYIEKSIAENGVENLHVRRMGLGDEPGTLRLSIPDHNAGAASFASPVGTHVEDVPVTTLDEVHRQQGLDGVQLIKVDVEGFEAKVFAGGKEFFGAVKPGVVIFEENRRGGGIPASVEIMKSYDYDIYSLPKTLFSVVLRPYVCGSEAHDFVAVHKKVSDDVRRRLGI